MLSRGRDTFGLVEAEAVGVTDSEVEGEGRLVLLVAECGEIIFDFFGDSIGGDFLEFFFLAAIDVEGGGVLGRLVAMIDFLFLIHI